tara:strand:- start:136 stop:498 length:363 start_codon:yes stop_codon:yes gene_type:complete
LRYLRHTPERHLERLTCDSFKSLVYKDPTGHTLHELEQWERLRRCLQDINEKAADAALCIATGDFAGRGERDAYDMVRSNLDDLVMPYCLVVGKQDDRPTFQQAFPEVPSVPARICSVRS